MKVKSPSAWPGIWSIYEMQGPALLRNGHFHAPERRFAMKAVADTLAVARSNLIELVSRRAYTP
jgi:hypothetical protein